MLQSPVRLRILEELSKVTQALVGVLALAVDVRPSVASHHLNLMESYGLVEKVLAGRYVFYKLPLVLGNHRLREAEVFLGELIRG